MTNITKRIARVCSLIQLPTLLIWSASVIVLVIAGLCGVQWLGVGAALVFLVSMVVAAAAIIIEMLVVYRTFDRSKRTWTTAWGTTFTEAHMPGRADA